MIAARRAGADRLRGWRVVESASSPTKPTCTSSTTETHASAASVAAWRDNVVVVGTFSKSFAMTGWRVGYLLADRRVCEQAIKIQDAMIICAPVISQRAVEAAVREDWNYAHSVSRRAARARRRSAARGDSHAFRVCTGSRPAAGFSRSSGCRHASTRDQLAADDPRARPRGHHSRRSVRQGGEGFLRLSYGRVGVDELKEACERLRGFFAS